MEKYWKISLCSKLKKNLNVYKDNVVLHIVEPFKFLLLILMRAKVVIKEMKLIYLINPCNYHIFSINNLSFCTFCCLNRPEMTVSKTENG